MIGYYFNLNPSKHLYQLLCNIFPNKMFPCDADVFTYNNPSSRKCHSLYTYSSLYAH